MAVAGNTQRWRLALHRTASVRRNPHSLLNAIAFTWRVSGRPGGPTFSTGAVRRVSLKVIDDRTIAFADFRGNKQFISTGNITTDNRVALIMVDYPHQARLKILGRAEIFEGEQAQEWIEQAPATRIQSSGRAGVRHSRRSVRLELSAAHHAAFHGGTDSRKRWRLSSVVCRIWNEKTKSFAKRLNRPEAAPRIPSDSEGDKFMNEIEPARFSRRRLFAMAAFPLEPRCCPAPAFREGGRHRSDHGQCGSEG